MRNLFSVLLMFIISFAISDASAVPKGSPPSEKQMVTVQTVATVDQVVNFKIYAIGDVGFSYCVEKQSANIINTEICAIKPCSGYVYTDKDYGSQCVKAINYIENKNKYNKNVSWLICWYGYISPHLQSFTSPIIT